MPKNTAKDYAVALYRLTKGLPEKELSRVLREFVAGLYKAGVFKQSEQIIREFVKYSKKEEGIINIEVTSARKLDDKTIEKIMKTFGKKVEVTQSTDELMLGGIKIKTEDMILDGSIRKQLQILKQSLT